MSPFSFRPPLWTLGYRGFIQYVESYPLGLQELGNSFKDVCIAHSFVRNVEVWDVDERYTPTIIRNITCDIHICFVCQVVADIRFSS